MIGQSDSMVEIKRTPSGNVVDGTPVSPTESRGLEESKYRLVYSKSKVYVNPTAYARDNIPGFVALVKRVSRSSTIASLHRELITILGSCQSYLLTGMDT